ncbi:thiamine-binding protein [Candidatus Pacearchaeota archaeon]|nr:MAG: thiamine-binding protein [Candidatus Pacearchaeota archaeon]
MSIIVSISIFPLDKGESVSKYVARVIDVIDKYGLPYVLTPMETVIEAEEIDKILALIKDCFSVLERDCNRIIANIKFDYRKGKSGRIKSKIQSIEEKLGRTVSKI